MAIEAVFSESIAHAGVGVALALVDFLTSKFTNPTATRIARKTRYLQAIAAVLDAETPLVDVSEPDAEASPRQAVVSKMSVEYAEQVSVVRDYLRTSGLAKLQVPLFQRIKDGVRHLLAHEKINTLSSLPKLGIAAVLEILYDVLFEFQLRGAAGIAASLYQIIALFVGMWAGTWLNKILNLFLSSADERKIEKILNKLIQDTAIVDIVMKYEPPEAVKAELSSRGIDMYVSQLTRAGKGAYKHLQHLAESAKDAAGAAQKAAGDVVRFPQKQQEKEEQERAERRKRFDDLTKGH
jgi:hypothetical protein